VSAWLSYALAFLPLAIVVSLVCAAVKDDCLSRIAVRGLSMTAMLTAGMMGLALLLYGLIFLFL